MSAAEERSSCLRWQVPPTSALENAHELAFTPTPPSRVYVFGNPPTACGATERCSCKPHWDGATANSISSRVCDSAQQPAASATQAGAEEASVSTAFRCAQCR